MIRVDSISNSEGQTFECEVVRRLTARSSAAIRFVCVFCGFFVLTAPLLSAARAFHSYQSKDSLTPLQLEIEKQRQRLKSSQVEERREALTRLGAMSRPEASRVALSALSDNEPVVRATATASVLALPSGESAAVLIPLLGDKDPFVRREAAYALGSTRSKIATLALIDRVKSDKDDGVRGAAAVALGEISDPAAVASLAQVLCQQNSPVAAVKAGKAKCERNHFVLRAVAHSLGQIKSRSAAPALIATLENETLSDDVRREAAQSLGVLADPSAITVLRRAATSRDPYLARIAFEALRSISLAAANPTP